jgi:hypothetical protein
MTDTWKAIALDKKTRQQASIPQDWLVSPPSADRLNVIDFPRESGLLSPIELTITESTVETLLANLASSTWTSVDVTRAFYKRAILAHQAVNTYLLTAAHIILIWFVGELFDGNIRGPSLEQSCTARCTSQKQGHSRWAATRSSDICKGPVVYERA